MVRIIPLSIEEVDVLEVSSIRNSVPLELFAAVYDAIVGDHAEPHDKVHVEHPIEHCTGVLNRLLIHVNRGSVDPKEEVFVNPVHHCQIHY